MNIYNNDGKTTRSKSACSYCRAEGHNATQCPRVAEDYAWFTQSPPVIPIGVSATPKTNGWYATPKYWGEWYENCMKAHAKQQQAKKRSTNPRIRSASKCGFCGSTDHTRRNCQAMKDYNDLAIRANQNWRKAFYEKFVQQMGISEGALLNLSKTDGYGSHRKTEELIGIVTRVNWDELSLFCAGLKDTDEGYEYRDEQYKQYLKVEVQIGSETKMVDFGHLFFMENDRQKSLIKYSGSRYYWQAPDFVSVLSPSETPLGMEWVEEGHAKAMQFLTKKRSKDKLKKADVSTLIAKWV